MIETYMRTGIVTSSQRDRAKTGIGHELRVSVRSDLVSNQCVEGRSASDSGPIAEFHDGRGGCSQALIILIHLKNRTVKKKKKKKIRIFAERYKFFILYALN